MNRAEMGSTDIRKFKQWLDAEYTVVGVDNNRMRLAVDGVFGEYDAMANIWIEHKGVRVSVGSGFTAEQRIRYGQRPGDIVSPLPKSWERELTSVDWERGDCRVLFRISVVQS